MKAWKIGFYLTLVGLFSFAEGSVRLYNDSPYKLRAVIQSADGTNLGEMLILSQHLSTWSDNYSSFGSGGGYYSEQPRYSQTPYTVQWYCPDGGQFGFCESVSPGATVRAEGCSGPRYCKPPEKKKEEISS